MKKIAMKGPISAAFGAAAFLAMTAASVPAKAEDPAVLKIGVVLRIGHEQGFKMKQMVDLMIDEQNKKGGINGRQLKTFIYDEGCVPNTGIDEATRTIEQDHVLLVLGASCSGVTLAMVPITARLETVEITGQSTASAITQQGSAWFFRTAVPDSYQAAALADFLVKDSGKKRIAILHETEAMGAGYANDFIARLKSAYNIDPVIVERSVAGDADYRAQLIAIKAASPDVLALFEHEAESARVVTQARSVGIPSSVLKVGASTLSSKEFPTLAASAADKVIFSGTFNPFQDRKDIQDYSKLIFDKFGLYPDQNYSQTTDAINIMFQVLAATKIDATDASLKEDRKRIRDGFTKVSNYQGLAGNTTFCADPTPVCRDGNKDVRILQYDGGGAEAKIKTLK